MVIYTVLFAIFYTIILIQWNKKVKKKLPDQVTIVIKWLHYISLTISIAAGIIFLNYHYGLSGLWTTRIFIIMALITGITFWFIVRKESLVKAEYWYFRLFSWLPVAIAFLLLVPFLGVVIVFSLLGQLTEPAKDILYEDDKIRVQTSFTGVLAPPGMDVYQKHGFLEEHLKSVRFQSPDSLTVKYDNDSTRITLFFEEGEPERVSVKKIE